MNYTFRRSPDSEFICLLVFCKDVLAYPSAGVRQCLRSWLSFEIQFILLNSYH